MTNNEKPLGAQSATADVTAEQGSTSPATARHTPAPWEVYDQGEDDGTGYGCFVRSTTDTISDWVACDVHNRVDAHLIAAAPEMYEALKEVAAKLTITGQEPKIACLSQARAALAKAEGR